MPRDDIPPRDDPPRDDVPPREDLREKEDRRHSGLADRPDARVPTYQELLDQALDGTFPASDPLAIGAAEHVLEPHTTPADERDWALQPGASTPPGGAEAEAAPPQDRAVAEPVEAEVVEPLLCEVDDGAPDPGSTAEIRVPAGACTVCQTIERATLTWREGPRARAVDMPVAVYRQLLADGLVRRAEGLG